MMYLKVDWLKKCKERNVGKNQQKSLMNQTVTNDT